MAFVVAFVESPDLRDRELDVDHLYLDQEKQLIEEVEHHMGHFVEDLVGDNRPGKDLVDLVVDLEGIVVVEALRVVVMDLAHLVVGGEQDLDRLGMLDQPLYLQKDLLDHVRLKVVLEMGPHVVVVLPWQVDERDLL